MDQDTPQWLKDMEDEKFLHRVMYPEPEPRKIIRSKHEEEDDRASYTHRKMDAPTARPKGAK